jgi:hypothetical protein
MTIMIVRIRKRVSGISQALPAIALSTLDPNFERLWDFSQLFYSSALGFLVGLVAPGIVVIGLNDGTFDNRAGFWGFVTLAGFGMVVLTRPPSCSDL